jgi:hypothetical protein
MNLSVNSIIFNAILMTYQYKSLYHQNRFMKFVGKSTKFLVIYLSDYEGFPGLIFSDSRHGHQSRTHPQLFAARHHPQGSPHQSQLNANLQP